jgi:hypothetical protein
LGGDFNFVESIPLDKTGSSTHGDFGRRSFSIVKQDFELVDIFRRLHPALQSYSYFNGSMGSRLDRFYISKSLVPHAVSVSYNSCPVSDHSYVDFVLARPDTEGIGPGYWKLNVSLLDSSAVVEAITRLWREELQPLPLHDGAWWDHCKLRFKETLISCSVSLARENRRKVWSLEQELNYFLYVQTIALEPGLFTAKIASLKEELNSLLSLQALGVKVRARARYLEGCEKPSRYFLRLERSNASKKLIRQLCVNGSTIDTTAGKLKA